MKDGDTVQVINSKDPDYGKVGTIISQAGNLYYVKFGSGFDSSVRIFNENELYQPSPIEPINPAAHWDGIFTIPKGCGISFDVAPFTPHTQKCRHVWKSDQYFTSTVYTTCTKCGLKQEDEDDDFGMPF